MYFISFRKHVANFHYKSYFQNLLSFNESAKSTNLFCSGWTKDTAWLQQDTVKPDSSSPPKVYHERYIVEPSERNLGFMDRVGWMKNNFKQETDSTYRSGGYTFLGPFMHQFQGVTKPLMPGVAMRFSLWRAPHKFAIAKALGLNPRDEEQYITKITSVMLYVKVGYLAMPLWKEISHRHSKEPIKYFFRGLQVQVS